jgi:predicted HicB family RNase H-like nuclease
MRRTDQNKPASQSGPKRGRGRPSEGKAARMTFRFSPELHVWLAVQAAKRKTTRSRLIEEILETAMREQTKKP